VKAKRFLIGVPYGLLSIPIALASVARIGLKYKCLMLKVVLRQDPGTGRQWETAYSTFAQFERDGIQEKLKARLLHAEAMQEAANRVRSYGVRKRSLFS